MKHWSKSLALVLVFVFIASLIIIHPSTAKASSPKTIVVPDDYPTIQTAIDNADTNDTVFIKEGTYEGIQNQSLIINKTISLIGENANNTFIYLHPPLVPYTIFTQTFMGYASPIVINADDVKISGLTIKSFIDPSFQGAINGLEASGNHFELIGNKLGFTVSLTGNDTIIINNTLAGLTLSGSNATLLKNVIVNGSDPLAVSCVGSNNLVVLNKVNSNGGTYIDGSQNVIQENDLGSGSMISGSLEMKGDENIVYKNNMSSLVNIGSQWAPWKLSSFDLVYGNIINGNLDVLGNNNTFKGNYIQGIIFGNIEQNTANDTFYDNNFDFIGGKTFTIWSGVHGPIVLNNGKEGNYYSDYNGSDVNSDGIGDTPYVVFANDTQNYHYIADFDIANIILNDPYPLMKPYNISEVSLNIPQWAALKISTQTVLPSITSILVSPTVATSAFAFTNSTQIELAISTAIVLLVIVVSLLLFRRHRKTPK